MYIPLCYHKPKFIHARIYMYLYTHIYRYVHMFVPNAMVYLIELSILLSIIDTLKATAKR